ncbi:CapA family protein [Paenibacillus sp. 1011MAR3C5]|uniref:CapA family protein n=1 Tax=Paenibacillus sp. 1011MAR3C5 TaxID=1675787 RepID=UPI000E6C2FF1|nr:CapA family protein [Paenibacillus sp. 1011MAR3C5]RJE89798.1 CapA family protein [Paenibacillus sp. 1011MAR3C5]
MTLSRSESRQKEKVQREKRRRRTLRISIVLIGTLLIIAALGLTFGSKVGLPDWLSWPGGEEEVLVTDPGGHKDGEAGPDPTDQPDDSLTPDEDGQEEPDASLPAEEGTEGESEQISLSFVGDMMPGEYINRILLEKGYDFPYQNVLFYLSEPDIMAGNLELPITTRGTPIEGTPYVHKGSPDALPAIRDAGFDVLSLANNHAMDQGLEGMHDTMKHLQEAGIGYMGVGNNDAEAFAPYIMETKGFKVAYIGVSGVIPFTHLKADRNTPGIAETYETTRTVAAIASAKEEADLVIVMVHWGEDAADKPKNLHRSYAREYIDAGADIVIGSHPHVLQGFENYNGKWIAYSLGNFVYATNPKSPQGDTGVLDAVCNKTGDCTLKFNPMNVIGSQPAPLEGEAKQQLLERLSSISFGVTLDSEGSVIQQETAANTP